MQPRTTPLVLGVMLAAFLCSACSAKPVAFSEICAKANDKQRIEVTGYLHNTGSAMCSKGYGLPWHCNIPFGETLTSKNTILANIDKGSGSSEIDAVGSEGLKIRDDSGSFIDRSTRVKITAKVSVYSAPDTGCSIRVRKIERM